MNWFLAKIVYQIVCGDGNHTPQFDEQVRLLSAQSYQHAFTKAEAAGMAEEETFFNNSRQMVTWKFIGVAEIMNVPELADGMEVYSKITETENAHAYVSFVHARSGKLKANILETNSA